MSFGRKVAAFILSSLLAILLYATAIDLGFIRIAGNPGQIETILDKSGVYDSVVPGLLDQAKTISSSDGNVPLNDPIVRSAASAALTPQFLKTNVNQTLNSVYEWLNGKTNLPNFSININNVRTAFADNVAAGVKQKASSLPACTASASVSSFDIFNSTCLPKGLSPDQAAAKARSSIADGKGFLDNPIITAADLKTDGSNQSVFSDQLKKLPSGYQNFKKSPPVLILLSLILAAAVVFIYQPRLRGLRHVGFMAVSSGLIVILFGLGLREAVSSKVLSHITLNNSVLQNSLRTLAHDAVHNLSGTYLVIGIIYLVLGAAAIGTPYMLNKKQPKKVAEPASEPAKEKISAPKPPPTPAKTARKIKIQ